MPVLLSKFLCIHSDCTTSEIVTRSNGDIEKLCVQLSVLLSKR